MKYFHFTNFDPVEIEKVLTGKLPMAMAEYDNGNKKPLIDYMRNNATTELLHNGFYRLGGWQFSIKEYCNQYCMYQSGFNIGPRYVMIHSQPMLITKSFWFDELYGTEIEITPIDSYKQYVMIINGLLWMDNETINARRSSTDSEFLEFIINKYSEPYKSAYKESFHIFLSRFNAFRESLNKEDDKDGKKEI